MQTRIESINHKLLNYQKQLTTLSQALEALRGAADRIVAEIDVDRALIADLHLDAGHEPGDVTLASSLNEHDTAFEPLIAPTVAPVASAIAPAAPALDLAATESSADAVELDQCDTASPMAPGYTDAVVPELPPVSKTIDLEATTTGAPSDAIPGPTAEIPAAEIPSTSANDDQAIATPELSAEAAATAAALAAVSLAAAASATAAAGLDDGKSAPAADTAEGAEVIDLASRREVRNPASPIKRRAMAIVATLVLVAATTAGVHELMQTEIGQRILELGVCDGEMLSVNRNCAMLAWLLL